jgi:anti-sigma regulatory factor (Ser/Thr protein kinase)
MARNAGAADILVWTIRPCHGAMQGTRRHQAGGRAPTAGESFRRRRVYPQWMPTEFSTPSEATRSLPPVREALLQLTPQPTAPRLARRSLRDMLDWAPSELTDRIELLVSELSTNSVIHAGLGGDQTVDVRLTCGEDRVRIEVADPGRRFRAAPVKPKPGALGQRGFYLVSTVSDRWGVEELDQGKTVWFEIDL